MRIEFNHTKRNNNNNSKPAATDGWPGPARQSMWRLGTRWRNSRRAQSGRRGVAAKSSDTQKDAFRVCAVRRKSRWASQRLLFPHGGSFNQQRYFYIKKKKKRQWKGQILYTFIFIFCLVNNSLVFFLRKPKLVPSPHPPFCLFVCFLKLEKRAMCHLGGLLNRRTMAYPEHF